MNKIIDLINVASKRCKKRNRELTRQYLEIIRFSVIFYNMPHFRCRTWPYCNCIAAVRPHTAIFSVPQLFLNLENFKFIYTIVILKELHMLFTKIYNK